VDQVKFERQPEQFAAEMWRRTNARAGSDLAGTDGLTTTTLGDTATKETAEKSLMGSYGTLA
jgi:hypothetical protein